VSLALALTASGSALAEEAPPLIASRVWQARFEEWVEHHLVTEQIEAAAKDLPTFNRSLILRILDRLEDDEILALRKPPALPAEAQVKMLARGLHGETLEAARLFANGEEAHALQLLGAPELARDPATQHLRAQLLDHLTVGFHPIYRLQVIELYREALRLDASVPPADRAYLRIGQIYLELRFAAEARAALRTLIADDPPEPYRTVAQLSLAEASYSDRAPVHAIEHLAQIDLDAIRPDTREWVHRRHADGLIKLERYAESLSLYERIADDDAKSKMDPLLGLNFAFALLHTRDWQAAAAVLNPIVAGDAPTPIRAVAGMLLARVHRRSKSFEQASHHAAQATRLAPGTNVAALSAVEVLEAERALGNDSVPLPQGSATLVQRATLTPSVGLLSYLVLASPSPGDTARDRRQRLGELAVTLPPGVVQQLAHVHLVYELSQDLARIATRQVEPVPAILADVGRYLRPETMDENVLLLSIQSLQLGGDRNRCVRWARTMQRREPRPLRRGIGIWWEVTCHIAGRSDSDVARRLMVIADSGEAGPFALAVAAIAAETQLQQGNVERAALTYARALESFSEPTFVGPVLLRLGEIEVAMGRDALGLRRLSRGLALIQGPGAAGEPFRKAGIVALIRAASRSGNRGGALTLLRAEMDQADEWWEAAYTYMLYDEGDPRPDGDGLFARSAQESDEIDAIRERLNRIQQRRSAGSRARETQS
jgi:tetratricopeptide (TPR) repeat protein